MSSQDKMISLTIFVLVVFFISAMFFIQKVDIEKEKTKQLEIQLKYQKVSNNGK